jgi:dipeptidyl aminopeptidase/acylaminoacyl peptidase
VVLQDSGWDKIYLVPADGGAPHAITTGDSEDEGPVYSPDGKQIAFVSNRNNPEERRVWIASADGGNPHPLVRIGSGLDCDPIWSPDGQRVYFLHNSTFESPSLAVAPVQGDAAKVLIHTQPLKFANTGLVQPEVIHYKSKDKLDIAAILYKPLNYSEDKRYPAILWIHGGPDVQDSLGWDPWALFWHSMDMSC